MSAATHQASATAPLREIQTEEVAHSQQTRICAGAAQRPGNLCAANICEGFEVLTRVMLHLEQRAVEFVPRWRTLPGADADALMIIYGLRLDLSHDYTRLLKAKRAHKNAA